MPIINDSPSAPPTPQPNPIKVAPVSYQGVAQDTRYTPLRSLLTHVEGSSWTVSYYSQVLARDNAVAMQNLDRDAVFQQYKHITNFELKVTTPITPPTQDQNVKALTITGQSNVYPCGVIPNEDDIFVAELLNGRSAVFRVTLSEQRSIYEEAGWIIDYILIDWLSDDRLQDLTEKTVEELVYVSDFLTYGQNPLIAKSEYVQLQQLDSLYDEIAKDYFRRFVSNEYRTLLLPGQTFPIYDPFLTKAVLSVFGSQDSQLVKYVRELNVSDDDSLKTPTIWDALIAKKPFRLKTAATKMGLMSSATFTRDPMMDSVRYSGVKYVVYPRDPQRSEDDIRILKDKTLSDWQIQSVSTRETDLGKLITITELPGLPQRDVPGINRFNDYYVFSESFYKNWNVGLSALEIQAKRFLNDYALDIPALLELTLTCSNWGPLDQFYQIPVLLILIRSAIRRM